MVTEVLTTPPQNKNYGFWETTAATKTRYFDFSSMVSCYGSPNALCLRQSNEINSYASENRITEINRDGTYRYNNSAHSSIYSNKPIISMNLNPISIFFISNLYPKQTILIK